ncbi:macrophage mannose receptor 1-like [Anoplophora glabripennis]|uniref:macrophage mannose receptor 1-like n=1 Tax=Anoplophora glabripennis TaxID=217634 RepID=UPI000874C17B|nr:macrophage mannose receptor 1-like [Anoplophora glabripennis]
MSSFNYILLLFSCLRVFLEAAELASNDNGEAWNNSFLDDPSLIPLFRFEEKGYYVPKLKFTFIEAYQFCKNIRMNLVTIKSSQELDAMTQFVKQTSKEQIFWTSGSRLVDNKNWIWMTTMEIVEYTKWSDGQPDFLVEQCLELWFTGKKELYFNNRDCNAKQAIICETHKQTKSLSTLENPYLHPNINLLHSQGKSYYFGTDFRASFLQASQFCEAIQMKLVSINSETENKELHKYARDTLAAGNFWSSGFKFNTGKKLAWLSTGRTMEYTNWLPGQPGNINELCVELVHKRNEGLFWNDLNCDVKLFFICERYDSLHGADSVFKTKSYSSQLVQNPDSLSPSRSLYVSPNVNLLRFRGKNYYFSTFKETFFEASEFCGMIGMTLVSINSEVENKILYKHIRDTVAGDHFWTSGCRLLNGKNLVWLSTGRTVEYTNWLPGQPDNVNEMCIELVLNRNEGLFWNDFNCEVKIFFICERYEDNLLHGNESIFEPRPTVTPFIEFGDYTDQYPENPLLPLTIAGGNKVRISKFKATQRKASQTCRQYGMELFSIPNEAKNDIVTDMINLRGSNDYYWTSGVKQSNKWTWSKLQPIVYTNWYDQEPKSGDNQFCLQLYPGGQWGALNCESELLFICESRNAESSSYCESQPTPAINIFFNKEQGTATNGSKIDCSCKGGTSDDDDPSKLIEPRIGAN